MKNYLYFRSSICVGAGVGFIAWGLSNIYGPLAPIFIGAVLLVEAMTTKRENP